MINMKRYSIILICFLSACTSAPEKEVVSEEPEAVEMAFTANPQPIEKREITTLPLGESAPDFNLPGTDGKFYSLKDFEESKVLVIIFTCNHCPTAQAYEDRMIAMTEEYKDKGVQVIAISPNSPIGLLYDELGYTDLGDTFEDMVERVEYKKYNFPYLYDGDTHSVSMEYGPVATPHAYVFDQERKLRYVGRLDGSEKPGTANAEDVRNAIDAILADEEVTTPQTKTFGCSVKWAWKDEFKAQVYGEWDARPVVLEDIDEEGVRELLKNDTENLRLINVWATWCGPCIIEYPEFLIMHRMYDDRAFEFVSISADKPEAKDAALAFLEKKNSGVKNYIFSKEDTYALIEAIDPEWDGALPYTMLLEPGGKVVYKTQGTIDPLALKRMIVEHPLIGRYY